MEKLGRVRIIFVQMKFAFLIIALAINATFSQIMNSPLPSSTDLLSPKESAAIAKLKLHRLEKIARENALLKLPENRALVDARLGNLYWKTDQSHARTLFNQAVAELIAAQKESEANQQTASIGFLISTVGYQRRQILQLIVKNDEALAFDSFIKTRPQLVSDALAGRPLPDLGRIGFPSEDETLAKSFIRQENETEQSLALAIINSSPNRSLDILRRDSPDTFTYNTYQLLKNLRRKDQTAADEVAERIVKRLLTIDLAQFPNSIRFINQLLFDSLPENKSAGGLQISDTDIHLLAEKEADFLIKSGRNSPGNSYEYALSVKPTLVKLLPSRAAELNELVIAPRSGASSFAFTFNFDKNIDELIKSGTIEQIAARAEIFPPASREFFYITTANRIAATGDLARAKQLLANNFNGQRLTDLYDSLHQAYARQAIQSGNYQKAEELIGQVNPNFQYALLADLAIAIQTKKPGDNQKARLLLAQMQRTIPSDPATREDFIKLDKLASAYALVDSKNGFPMLETLLGKYVEIATAGITVDSFQTQGFGGRKNEILIGNNNLRLPTISSLKNFMNTSPEKTLKLIDGIKKIDLRINLELQALESVQNINPVIY